MDLCNLTSYIYDLLERHGRPSATGLPTRHGFCDRVGTEDRIVMPDSYLIFFNIAKDSNFGFLIRTANAFGATRSFPAFCGKADYGAL